MAHEPTMTNKMRLGFIGLGNIGKPIAKHLVDERYDLQVYDVVPSAVQELVQSGAKAADSVAMLAGACEYIGICVRDDRDIEALLYGESGLLTHAQRETVIAIHSTVTGEGLRRWAADAAQRGMVLIDAPITGGAAGAEAGTLCYMVGGERQTLERCTPIFETSASRIVHAGPLGSGIALKLCNNLISFTGFAVLSEALRLARASGLAPELLYEVGSANGVITTQMLAFASNRDAVAARCSPQQMQQVFGPFGRLGAKDLECAIEAAAALQLQLPIAATVQELIEDVFLDKA